MITEHNQSFLLRYGHRDHLPPSDTLPSWELMHFARRNDLKDEEINHIKNYHNGTVVQNLLANPSVGYHHVADVLRQRPYDYGNLMHTHPDHLIKAAKDQEILKKYSTKDIISTAGLSPHLNKDHIKEFFNNEGTKDQIVDFAASHSLGVLKRILKDNSDLRYDFAKHKISNGEHPYRFLDGDFSPHQIDGILGMTKDNLQFFDLKDRGIDHLIKTDRVNHIGDANRLTNPDHIKAIINSRHTNQIEDLRDYHADEKVRNAARERLAKK